jgi:ppGpp synthetase/RelA/SpoT-type nucleotidyltranferase
MGARQGKVAIKKTVNRGGKSFQQTFYVSPQEAIAMQRKAKKEMESAHGKRRKEMKGERVGMLTERAESEFKMQRLESLSDKWRTPNKDGNVLPEPPPVEKHVRIAQETLARHRKTLGEKLEALKRLSPPGSKIKGRVKEMESAVGKVQRKPKYGTADRLQDLTGTRVIMNSSAEVLDTVKKLREQYEIIEEDDYITPLDQRKFPDEKSRAKTAAVMEPGYRSYHMVAKDKYGNSFEIQLRTADQNTFAEWSHPVYKPESLPQLEYVKKHGEELNKYGQTMANYFVAKERNPKTPVPPCPTVVAKSPFGCIG